MERQPSRLRLLAASYIDLMLISIVVYAIEALAGRFTHHWVLTIIAFAVVEPLLLQVLPRTPGYAMMALVRRADARSLWAPEDDIDRVANRPIRLATIAIAFSAHRTFADGVAGYDFYYLAGQRLTGPAAAAFLFVLSGLWIAGAVGWGRCRVWAPSYALALQILVLINYVASMPLVIELAESMAASALSQHGAQISVLFVLALQVGWEVTLLGILIVTATLFRNRFCLAGLF